MRRILQGFSVGTSIFALVTANASCAQEGSDRDYDIPAQELKYSLREVARQSGLEIVAPSELLQGKIAPTLHGRLSATAALDFLLIGTALTAEIRDGTIFIGGRHEAPVAAPDPAVRNTNAIVVTATRIRGGVATSPVLTLTQDDARSAGQNNLGEIIRSLPQNFNGGQNPGVAGGGNQGGTNQNLNSASALNLRGLGPDATLTLINGHRIAYDSNIQAVDISSIPLVAVERIEIVTDGASSIYGSDAVGGVANVILKRDYSGIATSARFGASTDGGNTQQEYSAVAGTKWSSGGVIATFDFNQATPVTARQRSYTRTLDDSAYLLNRQQQYSGVLTGHQTLAPDLEFSADATFSRRLSTAHRVFTNTASYTVNGTETHPEVIALSITPKLQWSIGADWQLNIFGTYGTDRTNIQTRTFAANAISNLGVVKYTNTLRIVEANAEGPLLEIGAGDVRASFGGGYRSNRLDVFASRTIPAGTTTVSSDFSRGLDSYYGFGELLMPFVGPSQNIPGVYRVSVSAAARFEHYPGMAHVLSPKVGAVYAPSSDIDFKASWGKSFKAPTLFQLNQVQLTVLAPAFVFGSSSLPSNATALFLSGGNVGLRPERATTWTGTTSLHPRAFAGLTADISVFHIRYRSRVVEPVRSVAGIFTNPLYQQFITYDPSIAQISQEVANAAGGVTSLTGQPLDPTTVAAIIDSRLTNAASQTISGLDGSARYETQLGELDRLTFIGSASYLRSRQRLSVAQPEAQLAGTIFNPPHWRARGGLAWDHQAFGLTCNLNFIGGTKDIRNTLSPRVGSVTTLDLTARYRTPRTGALLGGLDIALSVSNFLNAKPAVIRNTNPADPTYDSTNYSVVGRFVSFSITKDW